MTIIAATDFSEPASEACRVAAELARATRQPIEIVHVREGEERNLAVPFSDTTAEEHVREVAERARAVGAVAMSTLVDGPVAKAIADLAATRDAKWIVSGWLGRRFPARWLLGSSAEKLCRVSRVPVLVVREPRPLFAWLERKEPLEVVVGVDLTEKDRKLATFIAELRAIGPCNVTAVHFAWPPSLPARFGGSGTTDLTALDADIEASILREITHTFSSLPGAGTVRAVTQVAWGRFDDRLAAFAKEAAAHLLVVASPDRTGLDRLWHGSVSRGAVHLSTTNVVCVPLAP